MESHNKEHFFTLDSKMHKFLKIGLINQTDINDLV